MLIASNGELANLAANRRLCKVAQRDLGLLDQEGFLRQLGALHFPPASGIGGPKGMDPAVVKVLHDAFKKGMEEQSYKDAMLTLDMEPYYLSTTDYRVHAMQEIAQQKQLVEELGLRQQ
jgi:hypothetical protein